MKLCILNTGGTISSVGTPLAPMSAARFADAAERLLGAAISARLPDVTVHFDPSLRFSNVGAGTLDSTDMQPVDWCRIAGAILDRYEAYDGFVLLHGTDTMDFTASALPFLLNVFDTDGIGRAVLSKPVILTGAQLPLFRETPEGLFLNAGSDGFANLCGALSVAQLRNPEVALFFDGKLFRGNRALKVSTRRFAGFDSPHLPPLAGTGIGQWHGPAAALPGPAAPELALDDPQAARLAQAQIDAMAKAMAANPVVQLPAFPAMHGADGIVPQMIRGAVAGGAKAIVLESFGEGNFPSGDPGEAQRGAIFNALRDAAKAGVLIIDSTRVIEGEVGAFHYAAGAWIGQIGAISAGDMTPIAAYAKAVALLAAAEHHGWSQDTLRRLMQLSLTGECRALDRLDARANDTLQPGQSLRSPGAELLNDPVRGPILIDRDGTHLWQPSDRPGRLRLGGDGHLRLIGHDGAMLWQSDAASPAPDTALLILHENARLALHDATRRTAPVSVFDPA